jgi:hypothetical protein
MNKPDVLIYVGANPDRRRSVAEEQQKKLRVQDNPAVTEVYVNKFLGAVYDGGAVALTFGSIRPFAEQIGDGPIEARQAVVHVTQRLALSPAATIELINGLKQTLTTLTPDAQAIAGREPAVSRLKPARRRFC